MDMKAFKKLLLLLMCLMVTACGGENLNAYKEKMLETLANEFGSTKDLLVKDLDIVVDSMSLDYFLIEDSITLIKQNFDKSIQEQKRQIEWRQKEIETIEKANKKNYRTYTIKKYKSDIVQLEKKIESLREKLENELAKYEGRNIEDVVYNVFSFRVTMKNPQNGIHVKHSDYCLFSPDGEKCILDIDSEMKAYLKNRKKIEQNL